MKAKSQTATISAIRKVAVAVTLSYASWRDFLSGFFDYAKQKTHWDIRVVQSTEDLERIASSCNGIVTGIKPSYNVLAACAKTAAPLISVGAEWNLNSMMGGG